MSATNLGHITLAAYTHPELYPPVLAAVEQLESHTSGITILTRRMLESRWTYPSNVTLHYVNDEPYKGFEIEQISVSKKIRHFLRFVKQLKALLKAKQSKVLMVHDVIPLFAAYILRHFLKRRGIKIWYHNHDVTDISKAGTYSLMGIAARFEDKAFAYIDCFSLPAKERLHHFPIERLKNEPIILPNYPLRRFYNSAQPSSSIKGNIKLVYQGSIGPGHGLETLVLLLGHEINGQKVELHLVGKMRPAYKAQLSKLALEHKVEDYLMIHGMQPFSTLPLYLSQFDIGLAIHEPYNVTYATGGSASNKIYEYAACGLPVILYDNPHYKEYLEARDWTFFTEITVKSLKTTIVKIQKDFASAAKAAREDFEQHYNFETMFGTKLPQISKQLGELSHD